MGNYATVEMIRSFKVAGETLALDCYEDAEIEIDIGLAESFVEGITGNIFYSTQRLFKFDGGGMESLFFTPLTRWQLLSINSINVYYEDQVTIWYTPIENEDFTRYPYYLQCPNLYGICRARDAFGRGGHWPRGLENIWIDGQWGNAVVPAEIRRAVILLVAERLLPGSTLMAPKDITQAVWSDFTITFKAQSDLVGQATGFTEVDRLLSGYVNYIGMFQSIPDTKQFHDGKSLRIVGR